MSTVGTSMVMTQEERNLSDLKPIKLRSACNCCFAAKVRCDGNKKGCERCTEKRLQCTYSESMVGKVVGKRRKRPLPNSKDSERSLNQWNTIVGPAAMPSPTPTSASDRHWKRTCVSSHWTDLVQFDDQCSMDFSGCDEQYLDLDFPPAVGVSMTSDMPHMPRSGLPTPSLSPPEAEYLSPLELQPSPIPKPSTITPAQTHNFLPQMASSLPAYQQLLPTEDDETACLRLLTYLKCFPAPEQQSFHATLALVNKTNAVIRRMVRSQTTRTEYTCQLLLTSIMMHLTVICERLMVLPHAPSSPSPLQEFIVEPPSYSFDSCHENSIGTHQSAKSAVREAAALCTRAGDLLKRKPLNGFQVLGKQERAHIEVDLRLRHVIASLP